MKNRELKIESKPWKSAKEDALEKARSFDEGEDREDQPRTITFEDPTDIQRILTEKRLEIINYLMHNEVESIRQLADELDRNPAEVHDDIHILEEYKIVVLEENGRAKKPTVPYDDIDISVSLAKSSEAPA